MKNLNELAVSMCKLEGKKKQINIAQMKEALFHLRYLIKTNPKVLILLLK